MTYYLWHISYNIGTDDHGYWFVRLLVGYFDTVMSCLFGAGGSEYDGLTGNARSPPFFCTVISAPCRRRPDAIRESISCRCLPRSDSSSPPRHWPTPSSAPNKKKASRVWAAREGMTARGGVTSRSRGGGTARDGLSARGMERDRHAAPPFRMEHLGACRRRRTDDRGLIGA